MKPFIVAEVTKNWHWGVASHDTPLLAIQFEDIIEIHRKRGYRLHSFQLHQCITEPGHMVETIVAVFERSDVVEGPRDMYGRPVPVIGQSPL